MLKCLNEIMSVLAKLKYLRIAPRKVRLVADLIRKKKVEEAKTILNFTTKKAAKPLLKLLNAAAADDKHNFQLDPFNLYISKITVDEGQKYKRWMPRERGVATEIQKKTSQVVMILEETIPGQKVKKAKKEKLTIIKEKTKTLEEVKKEMGLKEEEGEKKKEGFRKEPQKPKKRWGIKRFFRRKAF